MKLWLPVLFLLTGRGRSISCKHPVQSTSKPDFGKVKSKAVPVQAGTPSKKADPFERYLADQKTNASGLALSRIAGDCEMDLSNLKSKRAMNVGDKWFPTDDLSKPSDEEGTDLFSAYQVWSDGPKVLVESWDITGSDGKETRVFYCFEDSAPREIETIAWSIPVFEDGSGPSAWGYAQRWQRDSTGRMQRT
jgi:hypothetical protein